MYEQGFDSNFVYDSNIALNDGSYNLITSSEKFMTFITTYSAHVPYTDNYMCNNLIDTNTQFIVEGDSELTCLRLLANETDNFIKILLERLEEDNLLDNTVLVLFSDHYSYGYSKVEDVKNTEDSNLIQKTPLIIWSNDIEHKDVETFIYTADIPTTLFNLFGIDYNPELYMGTDVFSKEHENFVYFSDYSWYDGEIYSKNALENEYIKEISTIVNNKIDINGKIISSNFYSYYK